MNGPEPAPYQAPTRLERIMGSVQRDYTPGQTRLQRVMGGIKPRASEYAAEAAGSFAGNALEAIAGGIEAPSVLRRKILNEQTDTVRTADVTLGEAAGEWLRRKAAAMRNEVVERYQPTTLAGKAAKFATRDVAGGLGSTVGMAGGGAVAYGAGIPPWVGVALSGAATNGAAAAYEARSQGATPDQEWTAFALNGLLGTSEAVPVASQLGRILGRADAMSGGWVRHALIEGGEEIAQESTQQLVGNWVARSVAGYDQDRQLLDGLAESGGAAGFSGVIASALASLAGGKIHGGPKGPAAMEPTGTPAQPSGVDLTGQSGTFAEQTLASGDKPANLPQNTGAAPLPVLPPSGDAGAAASDVLSELSAANQRDVREVSAPDTPEATYVREFASQRGLKVRFVEGADAVHGASEPGTIYVDTKAPLRSVAYHETVHQLGDEAGRLADDLRALDPEGATRYEQAYAENYQRATGRALDAALASEEGVALRAEMNSGMLYEALQRPERLRAILESKPGAWTRIVDAIVRAFQKVGLGVRTSKQRALDALRAEVAGQDASRALDSETAIRVALRIRDAFDTLQPRVTEASEGMATVENSDALAGSETPGTASQTPSDSEVPSTAARATSPAFSVRPDEARNLSKRIESEHPGSTLEIFERKFGDGRRVWNLDSIVVPKEQRGQGIGSKIMEKVVSAADEAGATIALSPSTDFGATSVTRLRRFYSRFGFRRNFGSRADSSISGAMIREPKNPGRNRKVPGVPFSVAYHGSPYDFDEFRSDKIGTGEGAQAFGHGLYFTDKREIAEHYKKRLAANNIYYRVTADTSRTYLDDEEQGYLTQALMNSAKDDAVRPRLKLFGTPAAMRVVEKIDAGLITFKNEQRGPAGGKLYEVDLAPAEDEYLLWDKPLSEQSEKVKAALQKIRDFQGEETRYKERYPLGGFGERNGSNLYYSVLDDIKPSPSVSVAGQLASDRLRKAGIRGIKYLAGDGSRRKPWIASSNYAESGFDTKQEAEAKAEQYRAAGHTNVKVTENTEAKTYNYVIFDPADVKVRAKFSVAPRTDSPEFKRWFGESKARDVEGKPRQLYHETTGENAAGVTEGGFDPGRVGARRHDSVMPDGVFLKTSPRSIGLGGENEAQIPLFASVQNPLHVEDRNDLIDWLERDAEYKRLGAEFERLQAERQIEFDARSRQMRHTREEHDAFMEWAGAFNKRWALDSENVASKARARATSLVRGAGFDGVWIGSDAGTLGRQVETLIVFSPSQVKSATGNRGTFDPKNPDIRFSVAPRNSFDAPDDTFRRRASRAFLNSFEAIGAAENAAPVKVGAETATQLRPGKAAGAVEVLQETITDELTKAVRKVGRERADEFVYALHAPRRNEIIAARHPRKFGAESNPGSGMTTSEANRIVREALAGPDADTFRRIRRLNRRMNKARLDILEGGGLIDSETRKAWEEFGEDYVPLRTALEPDEAHGVGAGLGVSGKESKRAEGRASRADSPLAFGLASAQEAAMRAARNEAANSWAELVKQNPSKVWRIEKAEPVTKDGVTRWVAPVERPGETRLSFKEGGEQRYIVTTDQALANAFGQLDIATAGTAGKVLQAVSNYLHAVIIRFNPVFSVANVVRDVGLAATKLGITNTVGMGAQVTKDALPAAKGAWQVIRGKDGGEWGKAYREMREAGGLVAWTGANTFEANLKKLDGDGPIKERVKALGQFIEDFNRALETGTRLATYKAARDRGASKSDAAKLARDVTVDFARRGNWSGNMNRLFMFFNANVQGSAGVLKAMAEHPRRASTAVAGLMATGYLLSAASRALGGDDDRTGKPNWDLVPEYEKTKKIGVMVDGIFYGIPAPWGFNVFLRAGGILEDGGGMDDVMHALVDAFSPVQGANILQSLTPTVARPFVEVDQNKTFSDRPIMPAVSPFDRTPPPDSQRAFKSVSPVAKSIAEGLNSATGGNEVRPGAIDVSPETLEHFAKFAAGGIGTNVGRVVEQVRRFVDGEPVPASGWPVVRTFVSDVPESAIVEPYYDTLTRIETASEEYKKLGRTSDPEALALSMAARSIDSRVKAARKAGNTELMYRIMGQLVKRTESRR